MSLPSLTAPRRRLGTSGAVALTASWLGLVCDLTMPLLLVLPVGFAGMTWVLLGRFPARGVVVGVASSLLGVAILAMQPASAPVGVGDLAVLGMLVPVALLGGSFASSMRRQAAGAPPDAGEGRWLTIVVTGQGPAPGAGRPARFPQMPRNDPERRRLARRAERRRELVGAEADR